ncbi:hypothetical protein SSCG_02146 [Streptomyces clavuligerus]|nr:hypothetical protein SSCG_02146 [Streptomyces clavuligerus]
MPLDGERVLVQLCLMREMTHSRSRPERSARPARKEPRRCSRARWAPGGGDRAVRASTDRGRSCGCAMLPSHHIVIDP